MGDHNLSRALVAASLATASIAACVSGNNSGPPPSGIDAGIPPGIDSGVSSADGGVDAAPIVVPDAGADTSSPCAVQPSLTALGADAGGTVYATDFTCAQGLDLDASTAALDPTGTGFARAAQARQLAATGDGGEGAYASDAATPDGGYVSMTAGTHEYASFELDDGIAFANADLTLHVAGPFTLGGGAKLYVQGNLVVAASGPVSIQGTLYVAGDVTIQQPTAAGVTIGAYAPGANQSGGVYAGYATAGDAAHPALTTISPGAIELDTRGAVALPNGYMYSNGFGQGASAKSGDVTVRAYGDIAFGGPLGNDAGIGRSSYLYVGSPCPFGVDAGACGQGANGNMVLASEGAITFDQSSFVYAGDLSNGATGGNLSLHAAAGVHFANDSYAYAGSAGSVDILTQGDVTFDSSYAYSGYAGTIPTNVTVRGASFSLTHSSYLYAGGKGGALTIATTGDATLNGYSYMYAGDAVCAQAGNLEIDAEGNIAILGGSYTYGGFSKAGAGCAAAAGGNVVARARGTIDAPVPDAGTAPFNPGTGATNGTVTQTPSASVAIGVLDAQLEPSVTMVSIPMPTASPSLLFGGLGATDPASFFGAHVVVSPDGTTAGFTSLADTVGKPLSTGWRYGVSIQPRMFDATSVDGVIVRAQ